MDENATVKIVSFLALFAFVLLVFAVLITVGLVRHFRRKALERDLYPKLASLTGWSYSPAPFPAVKGAIDYIDRKMFPGPILFGSPAKNILSGTSGTTSFSMFDYTYSLKARYGHSTNISSSVPRLMHETCVSLIAARPAVPEFVIDQKNEIAQVLNAVVGDPANVFHNQFKMVGSDAFLGQMVTPAVQAFILKAGIIRVFGNQNFLCVFFRRNENDVPDTARSRSQLDTLFKFSGMLGMTH